MNMNALSLYVTTCRTIFQADVDDSAGTWSDITRLLLYLRQALSCCICGKLLNVPVSSTVTSCQHHVCKTCVGSKVRLKPCCSWCKDHSKFAENTQLRILLQCYKRLCNYVNNSEILNKWGHLNGTPGSVGTFSASSSTGGVILGPTNFLELVEEGSQLGDKYSFSEPAVKAPSRPVGVNGTNGVQTPTSSSESNGVSKPEHLISNSSVSNGDSSTASDVCSLVSSANDSVQKPAVLDSKKMFSIAISNSSSNSISSLNCALPAIQSVASSLPSGTTISLSSNSNSNNNHSSAPVNPISVKVKPKRRGCRCGLATPNPGKLTCCGQRCPCYVDGKGCFECKCRGCRNPHRANTSPGMNVQPATKAIGSTVFSAIVKPTMIHPGATLLPVTSSTLLSPNLLLSTSASPTLSLGSSLLNPVNSPNSFARTCTNSTINFISSTSSPPTSAICIVGGSAVGSEHLTLPFPRLEDVDEHDSVTTATIGIGTDDMSVDHSDSSQGIDESAHSISPIVVGVIH
ncbi:E3 ubiquitin-protein ligase MSL2 [Halotydeus destructor]|nr:E3 ubiquitin-protein ligase MSL2 [Halotydeus destructor]